MVLGSGARCRVQVLCSLPPAVAGLAEVLLQAHIGAGGPIGQAMKALVLRLRQVRSVPSAQEPILNLQQ